MGVQRPPGRGPVDDCGPGRVSLQGPGRGRGLGWPCSRLSVTVRLSIWPPPGGGGAVAIKVNRLQGVHN